MTEKEYASWYENLSWKEKLKLNWPGYLLAGVGFIAAGIATGLAAGYSSAPLEQMKLDAELGKKFKENWQ